MKAEFVEKLCCPARDCGGTELLLAVRRTQSLPYKSGPAEEVEEGDLRCASCGRVYPITQYVLSFEQLFPEELVEEADYWGKWYSFMWDVARD